MPSSSGRRSWPRIGAVALAVLALPAAVRAQSVDRTVEQLSPDRPEAWAIRYFTSATLLTGCGTPRGLRPGSVVLGAEAAWLPTLSTEEQRVGFFGTKLEDLNQAPIVFRPRITVGLPARMSATVAVVPPVKAFGVKASLYAVEVEGRLHESDSWALGLRVFGQTGTATAAFTCSAREAAAAPRSAQNLYGCLEPSQDQATLRYVGGELSTDFRPHGRVTPHLAVAAHHLDNRFEVNVRRFDIFDQAVPTEFVDRSAQVSHGNTVSVTGGVGVRVNARLDLAVDALYAPLKVRRVFGAPAGDDGFLSMRALLRYRIR